MQNKADLDRQSNKVYHTSLSVLILERLHEVGEGLDTFVWHTVVDGSAASSDRSVSCKSVELDLLGLFKELLSQGLVVAVDGEWNVHTRTALFLHWACVEAIRAVDHVVNGTALL